MVFILSVYVFYGHVTKYYIFEVSVDVLLKLCEHELYSFTLFIP